MHCQLFQYLSGLCEVSDELKVQIGSYFRLVVVPKGSLLLKAGNFCKSLYFVNSGCLRFYYVSEDGQENTRYFAFENKFGTDLSSFITQSASYENIQALEDSEVLEINRADFFRLVEEVQVINRLYRHILESAHFTIQKRIYNLQAESALDRLKWLLNYQPDIFQRVSSKMIASYLGVTPYTLSRLKSDI